MVFGLFTRKSTLDTSASPGNDPPRLPTPTPSVASVSHHSPFRFQTALRSALGGSTTDLTLKDSDVTTESVAEGGKNDNLFAPPPPVTPSPPLVTDPNETKTLYDLMATIPPKMLHAYTLAHLHPQPPPPSTIAPSPALASLPANILRPPSPNTVTKLTTFFSTLAPPPLLHCARCHKDFYDIENEEKDKACRVAHDDESTLVSRVSGGGYETLWSCCGQTVSGDGSEGPPDGWCYEGRHTVSATIASVLLDPGVTRLALPQTDVKRARFRADSTMHNDKLTSCLKLNCRGIRDRLPHRDAHMSPSRNTTTSLTRRSNPSPARSQASPLVPRSARKRPRKLLKGSSGSENETDADADAQNSAARAKAKGKERTGGGAGEEGTDMAVAKPSSPLKPKPKPKPKSRPIAHARPSASTSTTGSQPITATPKVRTTTAKPKSTSRTLLSRSHTHPASDSETSARLRPRTRSHVREESRGRITSRLTRANLSERAGRTRKGAKPRSPSPASEEVPDSEAQEEQESDREERGRDRKRRRVGRR